MSRDRVKNIDSHTILDEKTIEAIRNPDKKSELELYETLNKISSLPN